uniref:Single-stranded DNA-binding protein n=1 Tax=Romanomermis culicivorax TaxID=13658 RepID=A0A915KVE7_ROMCU
WTTRAIVIPLLSPYKFLISEPIAVDFLIRHRLKMLFSSISNLPRALIRNFTASASSLCKAAPVAETVSKPDIAESQEVLPNNEGLVNDNVNLAEEVPPVDGIADEQQQIRSRFNMVHLVGRVGCDPITRGTETSNVVCFSLATDRHFRDDGISRNSITDWHNIAALQPNLQSYVKNNVRKGDLVSITGSLNYRRVNTDPLVDRSVMIPQIRADRVNILMNKRAPIKNETLKDES